MQIYYHIHEIKYIFVHVTISTNTVDFIFESCKYLTLVFTLHFAFDAVNERKPQLVKNINFLKHKKEIFCE